MLYNTSLRRRTLANIVLLLALAFQSSSCWILDTSHKRYKSSCARFSKQGNSDLESTSFSGPDKSLPLVRYRGRVAYDGSGFQGFQIQLGKRHSRTIQGVMEETLHRRFNRDNLRVVGAGRTDSGVHARGQAFHFDLTPEEHAKVQQQHPSLPLEYTLNRMLTDEIRVWNVIPAPPPVLKILEEGKEPRQFAWNAIYDSRMKLYSYRICVGPAMDPLWRHQRWHVPADGNYIDVAALIRILSHYEGSHDFRAFAGAMENLEKQVQRKVSAVRTIYKCELVDESDTYGSSGYYRVDILLSGALYKMVRNMIGTALDVSKGLMNESTFLELLHHGDSHTGSENHNGIAKPQLGRKNNPAKPAPPEGLTLERVYYEDGDAF